MALLKKVLILLVVILFGLYAILQSFIIFAPFGSRPVKSDGMLILGHALKDGASPDERLEERLQKGLELYKNTYARLIIVSGGQGAGDPIPVAHAMQKWLIARGVDEKDIIVEDRAHNTYENIIYSKAYIERYSIRSVIIVTNDFHIFRSMLIAGKHYEKCTAASAPSRSSFQRLLAYLRETAAVIKYWLPK